MSRHHLGAYTAFCRDCRHDFRRIARKAQDCEADDVASQAWIVAFELEAEGLEVDFSSADFRKKLLSYLYQDFVRFGDRKVAYAKRFETDEESSGTRPLLEKLASPSLDPQALAMLDEDEIVDIIPYRHSLAAAWVELVGRHGNHMPSIARHLMISLSWCRRCYRRAIWLAQTQQPLPDVLKVLAGEQPGPWRRYKITREPRQLSFDFDPKLPFFDSAWKLLQIRYCSPCRSYQLDHTFDKDSACFSTNSIAASSPTGGYFHLFGVRRTKIRSFDRTTCHIGIVRTNHPIGQKKRRHSAFSLESRSQLPLTPTRSSPAACH
jgi:hypothetical protein